ncbi:NTP transferase domain-containing protein [candidate division KSB1 bacterium]|nr:NTP transferase domain-containing protein [candidate division KSB1 bacterium]
MEQNFQKIGGVILAAGKSTRMKSKINKMLTFFNGKPLIQHVVNAGQQAGLNPIILVIGPDGDGFKNLFGNSVQYAIQEERLGTGHALMQAESLIPEDLEHIVLMVGDHPFMSADCIQFLIENHLAKKAAASLLTVIFDDVSTYGRIVRGQEGKILRIVEHKDTSEAERQIKEVNISTYCFTIKKVMPLLQQLRANNVQKEYYLTDIIEILLKNGEIVQAIPYPDNKIGVGINHRVDLANALAIARKEYLEKLMLSGVTILDPDSTFIDSTVTVGSDTTIYPFSYIEQKTIIGSDCRIGPHVRITNSQIPDNSAIEFSVIETSEFQCSVKIGPFAHYQNNLPKK